jgi:hypothetical protein
VLVGIGFGADLLGEEVCLPPVARIHDPGGKGGIVVSWTTHHGAHAVMNGAVAQVLDALRYQLRPFGLGRRVDRDRPPGSRPGTRTVSAAGQRR